MSNADSSNQEPSSRARKCSGCGREYRPGEKVCPFCVPENLVVRLPEFRKAERKEWLPWALLASSILIALWLLRLLWHWLDDLLKGRW
jgi:hypothetical protein